LTVRSLGLEAVEENVSSPVEDPSTAAVGTVAAKVTVGRAGGDAALDRPVADTADRRQYTDKAARPAAMCGLIGPAILPGPREVE